VRRVAKRETFQCGKSRSADADKRRARGGGGGTAVSINTQYNNNFSLLISSRPGAASLTFATKEKG